MTTSIPTDINRLKLDQYQCLTVRTTSYPSSTPLKDFLEQWRSRGCRGIWFSLENPAQDYKWIPALLAEGFAIHHAKSSGSIWLKKWLLTDGKPDTMPIHPFTSVGVGGVVTDDTRTKADSTRYLLIREQRGIYLGWKFPGGMVNPGETLAQAVEREIREETGIGAEFRSIILFRHTTERPFEPLGASDLYFVCAMKRTSKKEKKDVIAWDDNAKFDAGTDEKSRPSSPVACPHEIDQARWMTRLEIDGLSKTEFHHVNRLILHYYDQWKNSGEKSMGFLVDPNHYLKGMKGQLFIPGPLTDDDR